MAKNKSNVVRFLDPKNGSLSGQERVNAEIFTAMEILGRKLERTENERDHLLQRLEMIESAATLDEETGKVYLPVIADRNSAKELTYGAPSKLSSFISGISIVLALFTLVIVASQNHKNILNNTKTAMKKVIVASKQVIQPVIEQAKVVETKVIVAVKEPIKKEVKVTAPVVTLKKPTPQVTKPTPKKIAKKAPVKTKPITVKQPVATPPVTVNISPDITLPKSLRLLEQAAFKESSEAQHDLGISYAEGRLIKQNYERAIFWLEKASKNGVANATYNLAVMYQQGLGTTTNKKNAVALYEEAAEQGHPEAMYNLGIIYFSKEGTDAEAKKGATYFEQAANAGVIEAAYNLGVLNESNFMGEIDIGKAIKWYKVASNQGYSKAQEALDRIRGASNRSITADEKVTQP